MQTPAYMLKGLINEKPNENQQKTHQTYSLLLAKTMNKSFIKVDKQ